MFAIWYLPRFLESSLVFFSRLNLRSDGFGRFATKRSQDACGGLGAVLIGMASTISQNVMLPLVA